MSAAFKPVFYPCHFNSGFIVIIPFEQLSPDALQGLIEDFVTRDGTDYGMDEVSLESRVEQVKRQLKNGSVVIGFDPAMESVSLLTRHDYDQLSRDVL